MFMTESFILRSFEALSKPLLAETGVLIVSYFSFFVKYVQQVKFQMSFRELRSFTEAMRTLGYPRMISVESFKRPNFALVAEILRWLLKTYDPQTDMPSETDTETGRVLFIKAVAQFMAMNAHINLNMKHLYQADGYAVREMLKITSVLSTAMKTQQMALRDQAEEDNSKYKFDLSLQISELKNARQLASEATLKGASLHDLLGKEANLREMRTAAIARPLEINETEKVLRVATKEVLGNVDKLKELLSNVDSDISSLDSKIEKKRQELERNRKRLQTLQSVRPAFMDEYERIEDDLQKHYKSYMEKFRNLSSLESQLDEYHSLEQERFEKAEKTVQTMQQRFRLGESDLMWTSQKDEDSDTDAPDEQYLDSDVEESGLAKALTMRSSITAGRELHVTGNMQGGDSETEDSEIDVDEDDEEETSDLEDESLEDPVTKGARLTIGRMKPPLPVDSDDDF
ncbi:clusterin-associated protein 1 homolog [Brachionichthys hirsutus]|uniref:clusterin-associated protein 1 homolog n=1 Tax=Brachionichthys hirsutus TaxID=412623 RepID=UPI003604F40F